MSEKVSMTFPVALSAVIQPMPTPLTTHRAAMRAPAPATTFAVDHTLARTGASLPAKYQPTNTRAGAAGSGAAPVVPAQAPSQFSGLALGAGFLLAGIAALFAAGMAPRRFATHTQMAVRSGPADIRDLVGSTIVDETSLRSTQRIEDYCRQVPNRAATTLKELWLQ